MIEDVDVLARLLEAEGSETESQTDGDDFKGFCVVVEEPADVERQDEDDEDEAEPTAAAVTASTFASGPRVVRLNRQATFNSRHVVTVDNETNKVFRATMTYGYKFTRIPKRTFIRTVRVSPGESKVFVNSIRARVIYRTVGNGKGTFNAATLCAGQLKRKVVSFVIQKSDD
jgi:hypothetical protein